MATVYKRERSPYYWFDVTVDGVRKRMSTKRTLKREAEAYVEKYRRESLERSSYGLGLKDLTVREALFDHYLPGKVGNKRYRNYLHECRKVCGDVEGIKGIGGGVLMADLTTTMMERYRRGRKANGAAEQTIDHELKALSAAYNLVAADYRVRPKLKFPMARPKGKPRFLLPEEENALLRELDPKRPMKGRKAKGLGEESRKFYFLVPSAQMYRQRQDNFDLVVMLLDTGCRFGEIAHLTWDMVDTVSWSWVHIYRTKVEGTAEAEGRLATTNRMREVLQRRFETRGNQLYVFSGWAAAGEELTDDDEAPRGSTQAIRRAMKAVGINHPSKVARFGRRDVRSLRDTFATKLRMKGMSLDRLQKLLGHSSPAMTQKYANLTVDAASHEAVDILNALEST